MRNCGIQFLLAIACTLIPLYESSAASIDDLLGLTYLEIAPSYTHRIQYEDNIDYDYSSKDRISDWSNHYKPAVEVNAYSGRFSLQTNAELDIAEYINEKDFNYVDQDYALTLGYLPNERIEYSLGGGYSVRSSNNREEDFFAPGTDRYYRYKDKTTQFHGGFSYVINPRSTIALTGTYSYYDTASTNGSDFYSAVALYTYSLSSRTNVLLNAGYFYYDFQGNNETLAGGIIYSYSDYDYEMKNYTATAGIEHVFEHDGKILAQVGMRYSDTTSRQDNVDDDNNPLTPPVTVKTSGNGNGWVGVLEYQKRYNDFLFGFKASQDVTVSPEGSNYDATRFLLRTDYRIDQRTSANLMLGFYKAYADSSDGEFIGRGRDTRTYYVRTAVQRKLYRWLSTGVGYEYRYTQYKKSDRSLHSNVVYIDFTFTPLRNLVFR